MSKAAVSPGLSVGDEIVVEIERAASDGVCVARHEGQVVFVRDVLPGEQAQVRVTSLGRKGRFVRAEALKILRESAHRVTPPCNLATECGGCDWQHAELGYQREIKRDILLENLRKFGGLDVGALRLEGLTVEPAPGDAAPDEPGSQPGLGYRTRMRFAIDDSGQVGLKAARSHKIIPAADCLLPVPEISDSVPDSVSNFGEERALVAVAGAEGHAEFGGAHTHRPVEAVVRERIFESDLNGFWQVHREAPETLVSAVLEFAQVEADERILDLYGGVGLFAAFLAQEAGPGGAIHLIEGDRTAVEYAANNLADLAKAGSVTVTRSDVAGLAKHVPDSWADLVVADPPRAGLGAQVVEAIVDQSPSRVVYVSCDSATFARDLKTFAEHGWHLDQLRAFDLFPMTKHLETVALLRPAE